MLDEQVGLDVIPPYIHGETSSGILPLDYISSK